MAYTEANYENAVIQLIEQLGYTHVLRPDVERDYTGSIVFGSFGRGVDCSQSGYPAGSDQRSLVQAPQH